MCGCTLCLRFLFAFWQTLLYVQNTYDQKPTLSTTGSEFHACLHETLKSHCNNKWINTFAVFSPSFYRMKSTGPGGIKTMKQQSVPEMLAASRRTKYLCALPIWREKMPPCDRKWLRCERNWVGAATSLVNTRTASLTSDDGMENKIRKRRNISWIKFKTLKFWGGMMDRLGSRWWWLWWWMYKMRRRFVYRSSGVLFCWGS